jgi:hypothetical protein
MADAPSLSRGRSVPDDVTVCVTSCGRADLLGRTLDSFRHHNGPGRLLISEDSGDAEMIAWLRRTYPDATILSGPERLGMMGSVDRLYAAVETPFIFHLEDDWETGAPVDFAAAKRVLESRPQVSVVCMRAFSELKPRHRASARGFTEAGCEFRLMQPDVHPEWYGYTANPGLLRKAFWEPYRPISRWTHDGFSAHVKAEGFEVAFMLPGVARHIGGGRHVVDPFQPRTSDKSRLSRMRKKAKTWVAERIRAVTGKLRG